MVDYITVMSPRHVVVDGSNIATEGRNLPSLAQLDQAVREFLAENPDDVVTVVVDASFGHRIDPSELKTFEEAELAAEVVSPPAGAIGRGDAFLLRIAEKTGATVLSNDSFQEFHGEHEWLFDKGRLIGGKPVPGVGWIFTPRTPVRGPKSREAVKEAKRRRRSPEVVEGVTGLDLAAARRGSRGKKVERAIATATDEATESAEGTRRRRRGSEPPSNPVNAPLEFINFIASHRLGSQVEGTVESFSSHGAFVIIEGATCYLPLSAMGDPPPNKAREVVSKGETRSFVVQAFDPLRRGVELAIPGFEHLAAGVTDETVEAEIDPHREEDDEVAPDVAAKPKRSRRRGRGQVAAEAGGSAEAGGGPVRERTPARRRAAGVPGGGPVAGGSVAGAPAFRAPAVEAVVAEAVGSAEATKAPARSAGKASARTAGKAEDPNGAKADAPAKRAGRSRQGAPVGATEEAVVGSAGAGGAAGAETAEVSPTKARRAPRARVKASGAGTSEVVAGTGPPETTRTSRAAGSKKAAAASGGRTETTAPAGPRAGVAAAPSAGGRSAPRRAGADPAEPPPTGGTPADVAGEPAARARSRRAPRARVEPEAVEPDPGGKPAAARTVRKPRAAGGGAGPGDGAAGPETSADPVAKPARSRRLAAAVREGRSQATGRAESPARRREPPGSSAG